MAEVLLDIAQNASIRGMRVDGVIPSERLGSESWI
jgi:hypothetical protein